MTEMLTAEDLRKLKQAETLEGRGECGRCSGSWNLDTCEYEHDESCDRRAHNALIEAGAQAMEERDTLREELAQERKLHERSIYQRDTAEDWADKIAASVGDCGEHSNLNNPYAVAIELAEALREREQAALAHVRALVDVLSLGPITPLVHRYEFEAEMDAAKAFLASVK